MVQGYLDGGRLRPGRRQHHLAGPATRVLDLRTPTHETLRGLADQYVMYVTHRTLDTLRAALHMHVDV